MHSPSRRRWLVVLSLVLLLLFIGGFLLYREMPGHTPRIPNSPRPFDDPILHAISRGIAFLEVHQEEDGHFVRGRLSPKPAFTAIAVDALLHAPQSPYHANHPAIRRALQAILACQQPDGGIYTPIPGISFANYSTALCLTLLKAIDPTEFATPIAQAVAFLKGSQHPSDEKDPSSGGFGYQPGARPDLNNTMTVLEALHSAGVPKDDPVYERVTAFLNRTQNRSESNPLPWAGDDGGFIYRPGSSPAGEVRTRDGRTRYASYGTMTYAGLVSFLYANVGREDPRVQSAFRWIREHYDLRENVGMKDVGLYYYYRIMAKALALYGERKITLANGSVADWPRDLADTLLALQLPDGSWVNENPAYLEGDKILVTAYAVRALSICYQELQRNETSTPATP